MHNFKTSQEIASYIKSQINIDIEACDIYPKTKTRKGRKFVSVVTESDDYMDTENVRLESFIKSKGWSIQKNGIKRFAIYF